MAKKTPHCKSCDRDGHYAIRCPFTPRKPLKRPTTFIKRNKKPPQKGRETLEYERWRDEVAKPYLIEKYGEICQICFGERCGNQQLDVAHIKGRGGHHELKTTLTNVRLVGRLPCHRNETDHLDENGKFKPVNPHKFKTVN